MGMFFRRTTITDRFTYEDYKKEKDAESVFLYFIKSTGQMYFYAEDMRVRPNKGDIIISLTPPSKEIKKIQKKLEKTL